MRWSVGLKISAMNASAIAMLVLISIANYYFSSKTLLATAWREHTYQVVWELEGLINMLMNAETGQRGYLLTNQKQYLKPYEDALLSIPKKFSNVQSLTSDNPVQQRKLQLLAPLINSKLANMGQSLRIKDQKLQLPIIYVGKQKMDAIREIIKEMNITEQHLLAKRIKIVNANTKTTFNFIIYGTLLASVFFVFIGILLTRNIAKPLQQMTLMATKIAAGELENTFSSTDRQDEVGVLSKNFSDMASFLAELARIATQIAEGDLSAIVTPKSPKDMLGTALAKMVANLRHFAIDNHKAVVQLNDAVDNIFSSLSQLVTTGSETAAAVNETTTTIEEVRQTSEVASQKSQKVADNAELASNLAADGKKFTHETNQGMARIFDQMVSIADSMMRLSEQTQTISNIIEAVDDLAQQSNLLAVNASIEAEKAGDQGKGFHVVAQEIKSLADQSKQATHRVREILSDIQKATNTAVLSTEQGNKVVDAGLKKSEEAGLSITNLTASITEVLQAATQIASSCQQQLIGMEQAAIAMKSITQASEQNVDISKKLESAAYNLKELGVNLQQMTGKYKF